MRPSQALPLRHVKPTYHFFIGACTSMLMFSAHAEWTAVATHSPNDHSHFIQLDTVKQTGPMSIYRQVEELVQTSQGDGDKGLSQLTLTEYDCMNAKVRGLSVTQFAKPWAQGDKVHTTVMEPSQREWRSLDAHPYGAEILAMVCPDGTEK